MSDVPWWLVASLSFAFGAWVTLGALIAVYVRGSDDD